ncbi:MAG: OmpA family protein [Acetobacteraceae bacterium]
MICFGSGVSRRPRNGHGAGLRRVAGLLSPLLALAAAPPAAAEPPVSGIYIGLGAGISDLQDQNITSVRTGAGPLGPTAIRTNGASLRSLTGGVGIAALGYGLGNGLRLELEGSYRQNQTHRLFGDFTHNAASVNGWNRTASVMVNALYDIDLQPSFGIGWMTPYAGIGAGYGFETLHNLRISSKNPAQPYTITVNDTAGNFAFQAMLGAAFPIAAAPGLSLTAEYRFFGIYKNNDVHGAITTGAPLPAGVTPASATLDHVLNHAAMIGLRYAFNAAPPAVIVSTAAPAPRSDAREYLIFFDWDRADLTDRARQIIATAAQASVRTQVTRLDVAGHTDRSGTARYNQGLSLRRAQTVASELVRLGVPREAISVRGFGETRPLVPTADGVREPQNRRVEIVLH